MCGSFDQYNSNETQEEGPLIPAHLKSRLERLFDAAVEGADHAVTICMSQLNWLMYVDFMWTKGRLIPMLAFDYPASERAWNGFNHNPNFLSRQLAPVLKSLLLDFTQELSHSPGNPIS